MNHAIDTFTGIRPTADLTVANYIGAVQPLMEQEAEGQNASIFLAELHAATTDSPKSVLEHSVGLTRTLIASGIKGDIYSQRDVRDLVTQTEVSIRGLTTVARLLRLPTLKEKVTQSDNVENANLALAMYPAMMAADIILARPRQVPTGKDQKPHLEITNEFIRAFNREYDAELPEPQMREAASINVLSLDNSGRKMSKSIRKGAIFLDDTPEDARRKIMKAPTAPEPGEQLTAAIDNLTLIGSRLSSSSFDEVAQLGESVKQGERVTRQFKEGVADTVVAFLDELAERRDSITDADVKERLMKGHAWFRPIAEETLLYIDERQWGSALISLPELA